MRDVERVLLLGVNHTNMCHWERSASPWAAKGPVPGDGRWPSSLRGPAAPVVAPASAWQRRNSKVISLCFQRVQTALFSSLGALGNNVRRWFSTLQLECCKLTNSFYNTDVLHTCGRHCLLTWKELKVRPCLSRLAQCNGDVGFWHECCSNCFIACSRVSFPL